MKIKEKIAVNVLAHEKDIHGAEIKLIKEREGSKAFFRRVHSSIKLNDAGDMLAAVGQ